MARRRITSEKWLETPIAGNSIGEKKGALWMQFYVRG